MVVRVAGPMDARGQQNITVGHPDESTTVAHMEYLIHSPVPAKSFA